MISFFLNLSTRLTRPAQFLRSYQREDLRVDLVAGLTVAVILVPQAIAFALIAELPPQMGLYTAILAAVIGALWGSSNQIHTGPTNAISLLVLSVLLTVADPGTPEFVLAAGLLAVLAGVLQFLLGIAGLGVLVNFVSHSVIVGFASGAGVLIALNQLKHLVGIPVEGHGLLSTLGELWANASQLNVFTVAVGIGTILAILLLRRINPRLPGALLSLIGAAGLVLLFDLQSAGVAVIGQIPRSLPPFVRLPILNLEFIRSLSTGALAVAAIGLVETTAIGKAIATNTGQHLDSNQEFIGQGLANIVSGFFSGYPAAGSFSRSALNFDAGARSPVAAIISSGFVLIAIFTLAPLAAFLPRAGLAGVLIVTAISMINREEIARIWTGTRGDALIMVVTFLATLLLHIEFAVLLGILISFAIYIMRTSTPQVQSMLPNEEFTHLAAQGSKSACPQLGILHIYGDLYFGSVNHIENALLEHIERHPNQKYLLLRLTNINQCDFSGIHMLERVVRAVRDNGGDLYLVRVQDSILQFMKSTNFVNTLGEDHFLSEDEAITHLYHRVLDPAICIYECEVRAFKECQNLPKQSGMLDIEIAPAAAADTVELISAAHLWDLLHTSVAPLVVDVREPREFRRGHIPHAESIPLLQLIQDSAALPRNRRVVLACRGGRRSRRAAQALKKAGHRDVVVLDGGMQAWEEANLLEAVDV